MNILLVDDDDAIRGMLQDIIEDYELGTVQGSRSSAATLDGRLLSQQHIDILIIDMLMPDLDGITAVSRIKKDFTGKILMLSQVESKDMVGKAYDYGIDFYITKPLNRIEIVQVIKNVSEQLRLENFAKNLQSSLSGLAMGTAPAVSRQPAAKSDKTSAILQELGIASCGGARDLTEILALMQEQTGRPSLKLLFSTLAEKRCQSGLVSDSAKEARAIEQRLRRATYQAFLNVATMGSVDYTNPKFEEYAPLFFDYTEVRAAMHQIEQQKKPSSADVRINLKKFLYALADYSRDSVL